MTSHASQAGYDVRFEWGEAALREVATPLDVVIVVDVLSFSTCVDVACARGAAVLPFAEKGAGASAFARAQHAVVAAARGEAGFSLSPASLQHIAPGTRLVLPSPNGSALSAQARSAVVLAGCFRNLDAVARHAAAQDRSIVVVAAGERWADGSLRPAVEDLLCAGALIAQLPGRHSPEAAVAAAAYRGVQSDLAQVVGQCASAVELTARGFASDVSLALALDTSPCVPHLRDGAFVDANAAPTAG